jgi:hypothetical protein
MELSSTAHFFKPTGAPSRGELSDTSTSDSISTISLSPPRDSGDTQVTLLPVIPKKLKCTLLLAKAFFLTYRSIMGIGLLTIPYMHNKVGLFPSLVIYPIVTVFMYLNLDVYPKLADETGFYGARLPDFVRKIHSKRLANFTTGMVLCFVFNIGKKFFFSKKSVFEYFAGDHVPA